MFWYVNMLMNYVHMNKALCSVNTVTSRPHNQRKPDGWMKQVGSALIAALFPFVTWLKP